MTPEQMKETINEHRYEIESLKEAVSTVLGSLKDLTEAINKMSTQFAVYAEKHDMAHQEVVAMRKDVTEHGKELASMKPVVDGVRGLLWKLVLGTLAGGTGIAAIIVAAVTHSSGS